MWRLFGFSLVFFSQFVAAAGASKQVMDGRSFEGKLKATNTWLRVGVKGSIHFVDGQFYWTTKKPDKDIQKAPYQIKLDGDEWIFTAKVPETKGSRDHVNWQGRFDGNKVTEVQAVWTRIEKDFVHDLMLPEVVTFKFKPAEEP